MKITLPILAGVLCFALTSQADVFIYKNKITYTITGGGGTVRNAAAGWTVIDDSANITQVLAYPALKHYVIVPMHSYEYSSVVGAGKNYTSILQHDIWTDGSGGTHIDTGGAIGQTFDVSVNGNLWSVPKSYKWGGRSTYPDASGGGTMKFEESAGTWTFDKKETDTSNAGGENLDATVQRLVDSLAAKGYSPL